jgi:hypothetical protein
MGGETERTSPDPHAWPTYGEPTAADHRLVEMLPLFEDALWYLEAAATPEEILINLPTVLWTAVGLLGADGHDERIGAECEAWQVIEPGCAGPADFIRARDDVVRGGWQLDGLARSWLADGVDIDTQRAQAYAGLGELSLGAAGARLMLGAS